MAKECGTALRQVDVGDWTPAADQAVALLRQAAAGPGTVPLMDALRAAAHRDPAYQARLKQSPHQLVAGRYAVKGGLLFKNNRLVVPASPRPRTRILAECHDVLTSGHHGRDRTVAALKRRFYWKAMDAEAATYVRGCAACQRAKADHQGTQGLPQPLPIPDGPWGQVSLDFITQLPRTRRGHDAIMVCVDKLTKYVVYVAMRTTSSAAEVARLFLTHVAAVHGVPSSLLSDRDVRFTSHFWRDLWELMGTALTMSTAFHPQTDGQTERANRTLETALRSHVSVSQDDWDDLLPGLQMAANANKQASTGSPRSSSTTAARCDCRLTWP